MYCCYYKCCQAHKIVKYLHDLPILQWLGFIQNLRETPLCWGLGACPVKIMILEVRFLLTNFDSTAIFKTLHLTLNRINYYSEHFRGIWALGDIPGLPPSCMNP